MIINLSTLTELTTNANALFQDAISGAKSQWQQIAMLSPSQTLDEKYDWLGDFPAMREWVGDRVINDLKMYDYTIRNKKWEATIGVKREEIEDNRLAQTRPRFQMLGAQAAKHRDRLVFNLLKNGFSTECFDGQYFFDSDHDVNGSSVSNDGGGSSYPWFLLDLSWPLKPIIMQVRTEPQLTALDQENNERVFMRDELLFGVKDRKNVGYGLWQLAYGSMDTLTAAHLETAVIAMMELVDANADPLGIVPTHLVVHPRLISAAKLLVNTVTKVVESVVYPNEWAGFVDLIVSPWLV